MTHHQSKVIQSNNYYPFGLQHKTSWTRPAEQLNTRLYNSGAELNEQTKNYETFYRDYDPAVGRFNQIDPLASSFGSITPYNYAFNDPVALNDPNGDCPSCNGAQEYYESVMRRLANDGHGGYYGYNDHIGVGSGNHWSDQFNTGFSGGYTSTSAMIADAWNSTPENGWSITTYSNGAVASFDYGYSYAARGDMNGNGEIYFVNRNQTITKSRIGRGGGNFIGIGDELYQVVIESNAIACNEPNCNHVSRAGEVWASTLTLALITSQLDSPVPGPADAVAVIELGVGGSIAIGLLIYDALTGDLSNAMAPSKGGKKGLWDDQLSPMPGNVLRDAWEDAVARGDTGLQQKINKERKRRGRKQGKNKSWD